MGFENGAERPTDTHTGLKHIGEIGILSVNTDFAQENEKRIKDMREKIRASLGGISNEILNKHIQFAAQIGGTKVLQQILGIYPDGTMGAETIHRLIAYQESHGLHHEIGKFGDGTLIALKKDIKEKGLDKTIIPRESWQGIDLHHSDIELIAKMCFAEAEGEGLQGQLMIAAVILNRLKSPDFRERNITDILYKKSGKNSEFSPMDDGRFKKAIVSDDIVNGIKEMIQSGIDPTNGALFFQSIRIKKGWIKKTRKQIATFGGHDFYA